MNDDDDEIDFYAGFTDGSDTSQAAAHSIQGRPAAKLRGRIASYIESRGEHGATCDEVSIALQIYAGTASPRISELHLGIRRKRYQAPAQIFDSKQRRKSTRNRHQAVFVHKNFRDRFPSVLTDEIESPPTEVRSDD